MYLQFIIFSDFLTLLLNRFSEPLSRLFPPYVHFDLFILFLPTASAHILASAEFFRYRAFVFLIQNLFIFGASSWLIFLCLFVKLLGFVALPTYEVGPGRCNIVLYIGFWLKLIKISFKEIRLWSCVFTVARGRYR